MLKIFAFIIIGSIFYNTQAISQDFQALDKMKAEITYEYKYCRDSNNLADVKIQTMLLKIGQKWSYFINSKTYKYDSLKIVLKYEKDVNNYFTVLQPYLTGKINTFRIQKNYSNKNTLFFNDLSPFFYKGEQSINFNWQMIAGVDTSILGHTCKKASTQFAGRKYNAWFAPDIPISDGPYKFSGLPGLILQINSIDGQHSFTCTRIAQFKEPIDFYFFRAKDFNTNITAEDNAKAISAFQQQLAKDMITGKVGISDENTKQRGIRNALTENNFIEKYCK